MNMNIDTITESQKDKLESLVRTINRTIFSIRHFSHTDLFEIKYLANEGEFIHTLLCEIDKNGIYTLPEFSYIYK